MSKKEEAPPPSDIRLADEFDRLWVWWLTALEFVDRDQRLTFALPPWSADVTSLETGAWCAGGVAVRSRLPGRPAEEAAEADDG